MSEVEYEADRLINQASALKKQKRYDEAINKFIEALSADGAETISLDIKLRLPLYCQLAKRMDDAWREFVLLDATYISPLDQSKINDKMRLHLQREKQYLSAVPFGIYSYCMSVEQHKRLLKDMEESIKTGFTHPSYENIKESYNRMIMKDSVLSMMNGLLKNTKYASKSVELSDDMHNLISSQSYPNFRLIRDICETVLIIAEQNAKIQK